MAVNLSPYGGVGAQFLDNSGNVLTGGKIFTYAGGTTTPQATYTSSNGATPHSNPIILDAAGRVPGGEIWLTDGLVYKFILRDANDVLIATYDGLSGINSNFVAFTNQQEIQTATAGQTVFNLTTMSYQPATNSLSVFVDGVNQYGPGAQYAYLETDSDTVTFVNGLHVGAEVKFTTSQLNSSGLQANAFQVSYTPPFTNSVTTNVGDKLAQTISVKDFGAVGDGVTDDTAAIQTAIDENNGCTIYFPSGTYAVGSTIDVNSCACTFVFDNATIKPIANSFTIFESTVDAYGVKFIDPIINGTGTTGVTAFKMFRWVRNAAAIVRANISDVETGIFLNGLCYGLYIDAPSIFNVDNPIIVRAVAGALKIHHPIIDMYGKAGVGIDIYAATLPVEGPIQNVGTQIIGGACEGGTIGIRDASFNTQVYGTYFERNSEADISLVGSYMFGATYTNHTANVGTVAIKARNTDAAQIYHPFMANGGRSTGLFDFDGTNTNCYYDILFGASSFNLPLGVVTGINNQTNKPGPIGGVARNDGKFSTLSSTGITEFSQSRTASNPLNIPTATPTTFLTLPGFGQYQIYAFSAFSGNPAQYASTATVLCDGNGARIIANNGSNLAITLSGLNVQVEQTSGSNQTIQFIYSRLA